MSPDAKREAFARLGIAPTDDQKEIRRAWRSLVRAYHPDLARENRSAANEKLAEINEAFDAVMLVVADMQREKDAKAARDADVARRMQAAQRAEASRQAKAREAEIERRAYASKQQGQRAQSAQTQARTAAAAKAREAADAFAREQAREKTRADASAKRAQDAAARRDAREIILAPPRNPAVDRAVRAFSSAIEAFSAKPGASKHNTTC